MDWQGKNINLLGQKRFMNKTIMYRLQVLVGLARLPDWIYVLKSGKA
jgi:hypothetical protein